MKRFHNSQQGFTLIELSIVLIVIGLIVGGVLAGRALIYTASLRKIQTEVQQFETALLTFRTKYDCLAGDCNNATQFFGTNSSGCPNGGGATGTCNGNGDGIINGWYTTGNVENLYMWQQLSLAKLYAGPYVAKGGTGNYTLVPGTNIPASYFSSNLGYSVYTITPGLVGPADPGYDILYPAMTVMHFAGVDLSNNPNFLLGGGLNGPDAYAVDQKFDDGLPITGRWRSSDTEGASAYNPNSTCRTGSAYSTAFASGCMMFYTMKL